MVSVGQLDMDGIFDGPVMVGPDEKKRDALNWAMADALVTPDDEKHVPILLLNSGSETVVIFAGTEVGVAEEGIVVEEGYPKN